MCFAWKYVKITAVQTHSAAWRRVSIHTVVAHNTSVEVQTNMEGGLYPVHF